LDLTEDLVSGTLELRENALHTFSFKLQNTQRKYDLKIRPMDKIVVTMERIGVPCRVFSGYMNSGPIFSVWPRVLDLSATCTLKRLEYWYWDSSSPAAVDLLNSWGQREGETLQLGQSGGDGGGEKPKAATNGKKGANDGGLRDLAIELLTKVCGWDKGHIHVGQIPPDWFRFAQGVGDEIIKAADETDLIGDLSGTAAGGGVGGLGDLALTSKALIPAGTYGGVHLSAAQAKNASIIYNVAVDMKLGARQASEAIGCAMQESNLTNLHGGDRDSVGLFQQRPSQGWGTVAQCEDPIHAAQQFYTHLKNVPGYKTMNYSQAIQAVQRSANGNAYAKWQSMSDAAVKQLMKGTKNQSGKAMAGGSGGTSGGGLLQNPSSRKIGTPRPGGATGRNVAAQGYNLIISHKNNPIHYHLGNDDAPNTPAAKVHTLDCCLTADALVSTVNRGAVPIAEVRAGDQVWSWNEGHPVMHSVRGRLDRPVQPVYKLRTRGKTVRASGNHPFLALRRRPRRRMSEGRYAAVEWYTEWVRLDALDRDDLIVGTRELPEVEYGPVHLSDGTRVTEDVAWLLGLFLGNGHVNGNTVYICVYRPEIRKRLARIVADVWDAHCTFSDQHGVAIFKAVLGRAITDLGMAVLAPEKSVPELIWRLPRKVQHAFLDGYTDTDGHRARGRNEWQYSLSSASERLIRQVQSLHVAVGNRTSNITVNRRPKPITIKDRQVRDAKPLYTVSVYPDREGYTSKRHQHVLDDLGARRAFPDPTFTVERILAVEPDGDEATYDIEVEGAHNFFANAFVVHNSSFVRWAYYHATHRNLPRTASQQQSACSFHTSAEVAAHVKGAVLYSKPGHIELSLGNGYTAAAHTDGVPLPKQVDISADAKSFTHGGLLPGVDYSDAATTQAAANALNRLTGTPHTTSNPSEFPGPDGTVVDTAGAGAGDSAANVFNALINIYSWGFKPSPDSEVLAGPRALMNDDKIAPFVQNLMNASMRSWCSAPNGDFIAWFPDYFGIWGYAGKLVVRPIELQDFTVTWSDSNIVTHQYVIGVPAGVHANIDQSTGRPYDAIPNDSLMLEVTSNGIATMDFPEIFKAIFKHDVSQQFLDEYIQRFGARPLVYTVPTISQGRPEFFLALFWFMRHWADQFSAQVPTTFMPEAWPGMLLQLPEFNFQAYIQGVKHDFQYGPDGFFSTALDVVAPSRMSDSDKATVFGLLPVGGEDRS
jgi:hypothetical protein